MDIRSIPKELCEAFNAHHLDRIMTFFSDDCVLEMPRGKDPWGSRFEGKRNVREALATRFEGLPDVHYGNDQHFVDSDTELGISKWTLTGTTLAVSFGMDCFRRIDIRNADHLAVRPDRIP